MGDLTEKKEKKKEPAGTISRSEKKVKNDLKRPSAEKGKKDQKRGKGGKFVKK